LQASKLFRTLSVNYQYGTRYKLACVTKQIRANGRGSLLKQKSDALLLVLADGNMGQARA